MTTVSIPASPINRTIVRFSVSLARLATRAYFQGLSHLHPDGARRHAERLFTTPPRHTTRYPIATVARRSTVLSEAGHLAVWQAGPDEAPAVVLVHGWGGVGAQLGGFVPSLLERGFRVVWFDQPGHGESEGHQSALPDMVRGLVSVAATCGPFHAAIGHSIGAATVALALRGGLPLQRAVLIGAPASIGDYMRSFARMLGISGEVRERLRVAIEARYGRKMDELDRIEDLSRLDTPMLLFHDCNDRHVPFSHSQRIARHLRHSHLVSTHGMGHYRILRDPSVVRETIRFLTEAESLPPSHLPELPVPAPLL